MASAPGCIKQVEGSALEAQRWLHENALMSDARHLRRLAKVWERQPVYFITVCTAQRRPVLASEAVHKILREEWTAWRERHGWAVGRYVIMPDHVHFFASALIHEPKGLSQVMAKWKEWTAKRILKETAARAPLWQPEFFDHLLRSDESRTQKWNYVWANPVRAGLVAQVEAWPYAGSVDFE